MSEQILCSLDSLPDPGSAAFQVMVNGQPLPIMVVRQGDDLFAYVNSCPHVGVPLDWEPGRFLSRDGAYILCSTHGASFEIRTGFCVAGPCSGDFLTPVSLIKSQGHLVFRDV